jgi:uncharacterized protein (TIGR03437 family)
MGFLSCRTTLVLCVAVMLAGRASAQAVSFSQPQLYPTGLGPEQVAVADFNLDGKPDVAVLNPAGMGSVSILLGKGDGTFSAPVNTPLGTSPKAILVADFNGDGRPDVFTDSYDGNTGSWSLWVLPGRGDGTFGVPLIMPGYGGFNGYVAGDFNGDGAVDVAATNAQTGTVSVFLGNGRGGLASPVQHVAGNGPGSIVLADLNGDSKLDLVVGNVDPGGDLAVLLGNGDGTFQAAVHYPMEPSGVPGFGLAVGDLNGDGYADVAVVEAFFPANTNSVAVFLGSSDGTLRFSRSYRIPKPIYSLAIADVTLDGQPDILVANFSSGTRAFVSILPGNGDGTFVTQVDFPVFFSAVWIAVDDFNGDLKPDVVIADRNAGGAVVLINTTPARPPALAPNGVRSVANGAIPNPPGSLVYAQGRYLANVTPKPLIATSTPLPAHLQDNLDDVSVTVNGAAAPMYYALPNYVCFQLPWETDLSTGTATMVATRNGAASAPLQFSVAKFSPGIFTTAGSGVGLAWAIYAVPSKIDPKGTVAQPTDSVPGQVGVPATGGDLLYIYAGGLGPVGPKTMPDGQAPCPLTAPCPATYNATDYSTTTKPTVMVGGIPATVLFAGLHPVYPGLYLVYFKIPAGVPKGNMVPIQLSINGLSTDPANVTIAVQ